MKNYKKGFTLIELMVAISIIAIMTAVLSANFSDARAQSRDKARMTSLKELQLSVELYKAQYGRYPASGCSATAAQFAGPYTGVISSGLVECPNYIVGDSAGRTFVPDFIAALPTDTQFEDDAGKGFYYRTDATGSAYKIMIKDSVEKLTVTSFEDEFSRCPSDGGGCAEVQANTYAVYSAGAENW